MPRPVRPMRLKDQDGISEPDLISRVTDAGLDAFEEKWAGEYTSIHCPAVHVCMHERGSGMAEKMAGGDPVPRLRSGGPQLRERRPQCP